MAIEQEKEPQAKISSINAKGLKWSLIIFALLMVVLLVMELTNAKVDFTPQTTATTTEFAPRTNNDRFDNSEAFGSGNSDSVTTEATGYFSDPSTATPRSYESQKPRYSETFFADSPSDELGFEQSSQQANDSGYSVRFEYAEDRALQQSNGNLGLVSQARNSSLDPLSTDSQISALDAELANIDKLILNASTGANVGQIEQIKNGLGLGGEEAPELPNTQTASYGIEYPNHCNNLRAGTVIKGFINQYTSSDYTNTTGIGMVSSNVYSHNKRSIIIPRGSRFTFTQVSLQNPNNVIENRVGLSIPRIFLPNGSVFNTGGLSASDSMGFGALPSDEVDRHLFAKFSSMVAYALLAGNTSYDGTGALEDSSFESEIGGQIRQSGASEVSKYLSLTNTRILKQGTPLNIVIQKGACFPENTKVLKRYEHY